MRLRLLVNLRYATPAPARECQFEARLMPLSDAVQDCTDFQIQTKPLTSITSIDTSNGRIDQFSFPEPIHEFSLLAEATVSTFRNYLFDQLDHSEDNSEFYHNLRAREEWEHFFNQPPEAAWPDIDRIISTVQQTSGIGSASFMIALTRLLNRAHMQLTTSVSGKALHGDIAANLNLLMLNICRREGIPARYVSGCVFNSDNGGGDVMREWVECVVREGKWHGFDLQSNQIVNDRYIKLHTGTSKINTAPLRERYQGSPEHHIHTLIRITRDA